MMPAKHKYILCVFLSTLILRLSAVSVLPALAVQNDADNSVLPPETISISETYGHVSEAGKGTKPYLIICIRDRHVDPNAQLNISHILYELNTKFNAGLICLEGASRELDTEYYEVFSDESNREKVAKYFLQQGFFTGVEYFKISNPQLDVTAVGVEDRDQYLAHIRMFEENQFGKPVAKAYIDSLKRSMENLKSAVYTDSLKTIDGKITSFKTGSISMAQLIDALMPVAMSVSLSLDDYKHLSRYLDYLKLEKTINFAGADLQREMLIRVLAKSLDRASADKLMAQTMHFKLHKINPENFYGYLYALYTYLYYIKQNIDGDAYTDLMAYIDYITLARSIEFSHVSAELDRFLSDLQRKFCENKTQERLVAYTAGLRIIEEFYDLKSTHYMLDYLDRNPVACDITAIDAFVRETAQSEGVYVPIKLSPMVTQSMRTAGDYYRLARDRDRSLVDNTAAIMTDRKLSVAVMVTGGFHTQGITDILRDRQIPYVVISPHPSSESFDQLYIDRMCGKNLSFEDIGKFLSQTLVVPLITSDTALQERVDYLKRAFAVMMGLEQEAARIRAADPSWAPFGADQLAVIMNRVDAALDLYEGLSAKDIQYIVHDVMIDSSMKDFKPLDNAGYTHILNEAIDQLDMEYGTRGAQIADIARSLRDQGKIYVVAGLPPGIDGHAGKQGIYIKEGKVSVENIIHEALAYALEIDHSEIDSILDRGVIPDYVAVNPIPLRSASADRDFAAGKGLPVVNASEVFNDINEAAMLGNYDRVNQLAAMLLRSIGRKIERNDMTAAANLFHALLNNIDSGALAMITDPRMGVYRQLFDMTEQQSRQLEHKEFNALYIALNDLARQAGQRQLPVFIESAVNAVRNSLNSAEVLRALKSLSEYVDELGTDDRLAFGYFGKQLVDAMLYRRGESRELDHRIMNMEDAVFIRLHDMAFANVSEPQNVPAWNLNQPYTENLQIYIERLKQADVPEVGVIPDVHGDADGLERLLDYLVLTAGVSRLVFLGDLFDRGKQNMRVFEMIKSIKDTGFYKGVKLDDVQVILGNHDMFVLLAGLGDLFNFFNWVRNGGQEAIKEFTGIDQELYPKFEDYQKAVFDHPKMKEIFDWMQNNMRLFYVDPDHGMLYIHAGLPLDVEAAVDLRYRGLSGMQALQQMQKDISAVMADTSQRQQALQYMRQRKEIESKTAEDGLSEQDILLKENLDRIAQTPVAIFHALSDPERSPLWVRGGAWFDHLEKLERFKQYLAVIRDELPAQLDLAILSAELAEREEELSGEKERVPFSDIAQRANVEKVMAVVRLMRNIIAVATGEKQPTSQAFIEGIPDYVFMKYFDKQILQIISSVFYGLSEKNFETQAVFSALQGFIPALIGNIDSRFDNLYHNMGVNGVIFGHTPGKFAKNIDNNIFGMDLGLVKGFGGELHIGRQGVDVRGFPEKGARQQMQELYGGVTITDRINNLEQRLQRLQEHQLADQIQSPALDKGVDPSVVAVQIQERTDLINRLDFMIDQISTPSQRATVLDRMRLAVDPSGDVLAYIEDILDNNRIDIAVNDNQIIMAEALLQAIPRIDDDSYGTVVRDSNRLAKEIEVLGKFFAKLDMLPEYQQTATASAQAGFHPETMELMRQRDVLLRDVIPLMANVPADFIEGIDIRYINSETLFNRIGIWIESLDFAQRDNIQTVALALVLAIQPSYLIGMDQQTLFFDFSIDRLNGDIALLKNFLDRVEQAGQMEQDITPAVDYADRRVLYESKKQEVLQSLYTSLTPLQVVYIHAVVVALNGDLNGAINILINNNAYDLTPQEAAVFVNARKAYDQAENKQSTPFYTARASIMYHLAQMGLTEVYDRNFRGNNAVMNQLAVFDQAALLQPLSDLAQSDPVQSAVRSVHSPENLRVVMVEDSDGNIYTLIRNLIDSGIINEHGVWTAPEGMRLIQMGVKSQAVHDFMDSLVKQARLSGGEVVRMLGKQELFILRENPQTPNPPQAHGWDMPAKARRELIEGIIDGTIQAVQIINDKLFINGILRTAVKQRLISEIASGYKIAPSLISDWIIGEYINRLLIHAAKTNDFSHPLFQEPSMGGIIIADIGIEAAGQEPIVHRTINHAADEGTLELYPKKILGKSIYLVGDERIQELAPGQRGHAGIKRNAIYISRGAVTVNGQVDETILQKYAAHEAVELQLWQEEAIMLYMSGEYEHLFAAGLLSVGKDGRDGFARDYTRLSQERQIDERIQTMAQYREQLLREYSENLSGWSTMNRKQRAHAWNKLSPWMQRELRKMIRAWAVAYPNRAQQLSEKFHAQAQKISPLPRQQELVVDAGHAQNGIPAMPAPMESFPADDHEQSIRDNISQIKTGSDTEVGMLILRFSRLDRSKMPDEQQQAKIELRRIRDDLHILVDRADEYQIDQLKKLTESRRSIVSYYFGDTNTELLDLLNTIEAMLNGEKPVIPVDSSMLEHIAHVLNTSVVPNPSVIDRIESQINQATLQDMFTVRLSQMISTNNSVVNLWDDSVFDRFFEGLKSFLEQRVMNEVYTYGISDRSTVIILDYFKDIMPLVLNRATADQLVVLREAFRDLQARKPIEMADRWLLDNVLSLIRYYEDMLSVFDIGVLTGGVFTDQTRLADVAQLIDNQPVYRNTDVVAVDIGRETVATIVRTTDGTKRIIIRSTDVNKGNLKAVNDEDASPIPADVIKEWRRQAQSATLQSVNVAGTNIEAKYIVDSQGMPSDVFAYHFTDSQANLVIVTRMPVTGEGQISTIAVEAVYHEYRESLWVDRLTGLYTATTAEEIARIQHIAHILAAGDEVLAFGKEGLTPFHAQQAVEIASDKELLTRILTENRDPHYEILSIFFEEDAVAKIIEYEKRFRLHLFELHIGSDRVFMIHQFLRSINLHDQPELLLRIMALIDTTLNMKDRSSQTILMELVSMQGRNRIVVSDDSVLYTGLRNLVAGLIRSSDEDISTSGLLFVALQNMVMNYMDNLTTQQPVDFDTLYRDIRLLNESI
ncbi:MAG: metallophosphoesterase [Candidatus Auribacterota bacterium]|jgi:hypothetical protein|nr:metallophosphoesterase [Candidatus Auribacterota bacterium]